MKTSIGVSLASVIFAGSSGWFGAGDPADRFFLSSGNDWRDAVRRVFGPGRTHGLGIECYAAQGSPDHTKLDVQKTPQSWWTGGDEFSAMFMMEPAGRLTRFALYVARDGDGDGHLRPDEWSCVADASLYETTDATFARIPPVCARSDAFRFVIVDRDMGQTWEEWSSGGLEIDDPVLPAASAR